ncbi:hypothetical protein I3J09_28055 (plasmid) [Streptomyces clavuligerus]|nr:hypothetical protein D1794_29455 [Streptomyces clavuligerus]AXU17564.1 hypothetical protein D1794_33700 [Streptomyces clavuligerus]MBY6301033.1 hypothetical protein [Streptomyces clavuligerus]QPJ97074.1 hypothetical protein GE265_27980 [Streptomyces clavuligerus]QPL67382.1 hypothetical protein I3J04_28160 [Streptomyces clavuligerus]
MIPQSAHAGTGAEDPATATSPAPPGSREVSLTPEIIYDGAPPVSEESATKCTANGDTCQILKGSGLTVDRWYSTAYQFPADGPKCNIVATFKYNTRHSAGPHVWDVASFRGCATAPPRGYIKWTTSNVGPVVFSRNNHVNVSWTDGFGTTPDAHVHS